MYPTILPKRYIAQMDEPFVVFLLGMRVNRLRAVHQWTKAISAFSGMMVELQAHSEYGFLGGEQFFRFFPVTSCYITYWRSFEQLERYARGQETLHNQAWRDFYRIIGTDGRVGIWHETYLVEPGTHEAFYSNMPLFGLARVTGNPLPATAGHRSSARGRMTGSEPKFPAELELEHHPAR